jgi:hypothetical protein
MLQDSFPLALGLKYFVENAEINERFLDNIIWIIQKSIEWLEDWIEKRKLERSKEFLNELKKQEQKEKDIDNIDIERLDNLLKNI